MRAFSGGTRDSLPIAVGWNFNITQSQNSGATLNPASDVAHSPQRRPPVVARTWLAIPREGPRATFRGRL
jgi:hypothetical protein